MSSSVGDVQPTAQIGKYAVPPMAIGTWSWGDSLWGYNNSELENIKDAWKTCNELGLTFYDTAEIYGEGKSEQIIGNLIKETDPETRKKLFIATKYLPFPRPANFFFLKPGLIQACRKSLARLGIEKIDLYQVHANVGLHSIESVGRQLAEVYKLGLVKAVGVSNYNKEELLRMIKVLEEHDVPLSSNQVEFSLLRLHPETSGLLEEMKKRNIALLAYSPLAMGRLTGKYSAENPVPKGRRFGNHYTWEQLDPLISALRTLSKKYDVSISAIALNWVISKGAIPLGGARNGQQARQNAKAATFRLTEDEVASLTKLGFQGKTDRMWQHG